MANEPTYSPRSQHSMLEEEQLRAKLSKCENLIGLRKRNIDKLEKLKARHLELSVTGKANFPVLPNILRELEDETRQLAAFTAQRAQIEGEIKSLVPSLAQAAERAERQHYLVQLAAERLKKDELVEGALKGLRHLLEDRKKLSAKIAKAAEAAELTPGEDGLDERRFENLLAALPEELLTGSTARTARFLGTEEGRKTYVVRDRMLVIPETLASHGVYYFGERIELSDDQARELLREDRPARTNRALALRAA